MLHREYEAENEFSEATAVFIDYSRSDCYCNHLSALQNNSFFGLSPFLSNKWKEETASKSQSVKERKKELERERDGLWILMWLS